MQRTMKQHHHKQRQLMVWALLATLLLIGLALRLWFVAVNELQPTNSPADDGDYYQRALRFAATGHYIDDFWLIRPPLHVFLFAYMLRVSIVLGSVPGLTLIRGTQIVLSLLAVPVGYDLARRLFGTRRHGIVFAGILAVWYPLVELPAHLFTEPLFITLLLLHLWLLVLWRDERRWLLLVLAGVFLGVTALTRSVGVYGALFVLFYLFIERQPASATTIGNHHTSAVPSRIKAALTAVVPLLHHAPHTTFVQWFAIAARRMLLFALPLAFVILPWTIRNYVVYDRFILIDTIGSVNLWLHMEKYDEKGVEILKQMPQRDRHVFATEDTKRMFTEAPLHFWHMLWRNAWLHFLHIWKAQFLEDFLQKSSFYGRPLREMMPLGVAGDLIWCVFGLAGVVALAAPLREGAFRWVAIGWAAYTILTVMLFHLEPRYLIPLWLVLALYGAWVLGNIPTFFHTLRQQRFLRVLSSFVGVYFLILVFTYRDYPATLARGIAREQHRAAGVAAFHAAHYDDAVTHLQLAYDAQTSFVSSRAELAFALVAQGNIARAHELVGIDHADDSQHILVARGALALAEGNLAHAATLLIQAEKKTGNNVQRMCREWLVAPHTHGIQVGSGTDYGYIDGFSWVETTHTVNERPYRWLQGHGSIVLPLAHPLQTGSMATLRLTSGMPHATHAHVCVTTPSAVPTQCVELVVADGMWRIYDIALPEQFVGQRELTITLDAPIWIPAHDHLGSNDVRPVSLMINGVWVR